MAKTTKKKVKVETAPSSAPLYLGLFFASIAVFILISCISYVFTGRVDQDKLSMPFFELISDGSIECANWLGKTGALISHLLIYKSFGFSGFILSFLLIYTSVKLLAGFWVWNPYTIFKKSTFYLLFTPILLGMFFSENLLWIAGTYGYQMSNLLVNVLGRIGTYIILAVLLIIFSHHFYGFNFSFLKALFYSQKNKKESNTTESKSQTVADQEEAEAMLDSTTKILNSTTKSIDLSHSTQNPAEHDPPLDLEISGVENESNENKVNTSTLQEKNKDTPEEDLDLEVEEQKEEDVVKTSSKSGDLTTPYDPTLDLGHYKMPDFDLLKEYPSNKGSVDRVELEENKNKIVNTLKDYKIEISKIKATIGPTVTLYEIVPAAGVRISKIKNLEDDIALSLSALGIRIIAPIPGRGTVGIEVPNQSAEIVSMRSVIASEKFAMTKMELPLALGKTISNETYIADLAKMPHLLMAGATGQGKSVGLNAILVSLLYKKHPSQIKFVLVDPKKVELTLFNQIENHYLAKLPGEEEAIITDTKKVVATLNSLCIEMDQRYDLLKKAMVRNLKEYNTKFTARKLNPDNGHKFLPYIVLVIDEFADLIMTAGKEVETPIARLAQLARAIGIHLIIATQRPSVNIITGIIKANFPSRIAFRVTSKIDSRTILDAGGADQLIGKGDMLLSLGSDLIRIQCAFVDTPEVEEICEYIGNQRGYPSAFELPEYSDEAGGGNNAGDVSAEDRDEMFEEAARMIVSTQQGSTSMIQRKLKLGYNRAGRIMDQLEAAGIVGPSEGSKARQVLFPDEYTLEQFLNSSQ